MNSYTVVFELAELNNSVDFTDQSLKTTLEDAKQRYNTFYMHRKVANPKEIKGMRINTNNIEFDIESEKELSLGREGNALRQFSVILIDLGFDRFLSQSTPGKLFARK